ncbi:uncharacterized protein L969DRAFT_92435 [Mixia osmundae IAM 14324]|uniref:Uncharacterized protein n=1 Tax=Mixia osmundae (strain CBS 9802 / IAM 14324 / JCM 22182 / KY 12970) TaxID=764103 RepID=G7DXJ5_MIXOS|nr:uncharacterized protein L969DRAFT_92435 [Mixia osmundae IAM 14324]KEI41201.1 hypothetical protein L969DRAFT_92435 [Mixia osmundae IAM 14324]GAA95305.1 hypothetical protein E5Q_01962 [Mixia osmundae IAM 14324]
MLCWAGASRCCLHTEHATAEVHQSHRSMDGPLSDSLIDAAVNDVESYFVHACSSEDVHPVMAE